MAVRILVVDDNRDTRSALELLLKVTGHDVVGRRDGEDALAYLREGHAVALIILDVAMPRMDGFRFHRELKRDDALASIPVITYSSSDVELPGVESVRKADDPDVLLDRVEHYCQPERQRSTRSGIA